MGQKSMKIGQNRATKEKKNEETNTDEGGGDGGGKSLDVER